jgi:hypothetical protein
MKYVEIYKLQNNGDQTIIATCKLVDNTVLCEGDTIFTQNLQNDGIASYTNQSTQSLFPKDGLLFLENLQYTFRSGYLMATSVKEK